MCGHVHNLHVCDHTTYIGIQPCKRAKEHDILCVVPLTHHSNAVTVSRPRNALKQDLFATTMDTSSTSLVKCSSTSHLPTNRNPNPVDPDLPIDFKTPPLPTQKLEYMVPAMITRYIKVPTYCKECQLEREMPKNLGKTKSELLGVKGAFDDWIRVCMLKNFREGFQASVVETKRLMKEDEEKEDRKEDIVMGGLHRWRAMDLDEVELFGVKKENLDSAMDDSVVQSEDVGGQAEAINGSGAGQEYVSLFGGPVGTA